MKFQFEKFLESKTNQLEKNFKYYLKDFPLSSEDLQKPLLDVGAGKGEFIQYVREVLGNKEAFGVEKQELKINHLKDGFVVADGFLLPFKDGSFDTVIAHNYLPMFVEDEEKMQLSVREILRVVKQGGKMMADIATPEGVMESDAEYRSNLGADYNKGMENETIKKYEGAKKLQSFLQDLSKEGYLVETMSQQKHTTIVVINKPLYFL